MLSRGPLVLGSNSPWGHPSRRLEKSHEVWMMMMIAASLMWAGAAFCGSFSDGISNMHYTIYIDARMHLNECSSS